MALLQHYTHNLKIKFGGLFAKFYMTVIFVTEYGDLFLRKSLLLITTPSNSCLIFSQRAITVMIDIIDQK